MFYHAVIIEDTNLSPFSFSKDLPNKYFSEKCVDLIFAIFHRKLGPSQKCVVFNSLYLAALGVAYLQNN